MIIINILFICFVLYDCCRLYILHTNHRLDISFAKYKFIVDRFVDIDTYQLSKSDKIKVDESYNICIAIYDHRYMDTIFRYRAYDEAADRLSDLLVDIIPNIRKEKRDDVINNVLK